MKRTSTYFPKVQNTGQEWRVVDAAGQSLGRMARDIAVALQGKDRPTYTPHVLTGAHVVVINATKVRITGHKLLQKLYYRHSGYVGNMKTLVMGDLMEKHPDRVIQLAVKGMLPRNKMGREMLKRLKVYPDDSHPHQAQIKTEASASEG